MMARTHAVFALLFYLLFLRIFSINFAILTASVLCLGTIIPDIDSAGSLINQKFRPGKIIAAFSAHRGFWHSVFGCMIFFIIGMLLMIFLKFQFGYILIFSSGYLLHLAADSLTVTGIKWFWKSGHTKGFIRTGTWSENVFFIAMCAVIIVLILPNIGDGVNAFVSWMK